MTNIFKNWHCKNTGLLLIRLGVGAIFMVHGIMKLTNIEGTTGFFGGVGIPMAGLMAWVVALVETLGGLGMILGVFTKLGGVLLAFTMLIAVVMVKFPKGGFMASEFEIILLLAALGISFTGPGKYAIGNHGCGCVGGKCVCRGNDHDGHGSICKCGCGDGKCDCANCNDKNCGCGDCKNKCDDCANCKDENCKCVGCATK